MRFILFLLIVVCFAANTAFAQSKPLFVLLKNRGNYKLAKRNSFEYKFVTDTFATEYQAGDRSKVQKPANDEDCILFYPGDGQVQGNDGDKEADKFKLEVETLSESIEGDEPEKAVFLFSLKPLGKSILNPKELDIRVVKEDGTVVASAKIMYAAFPFDIDSVLAVDKWMGAYDKFPETGDTKADFIHQMTSANYEPMYLGHPKIWYRNPPELKPEEGRSYIMEGSLSMPFTFLQGTRDQARFLRQSSASIDPEFTWRIIQHTSSPLLPLNTKVGASFRTSIVLDDNRDTKDVKHEYIDWTKGAFKILTLGTRIMHYSNGQKEGVIDPDDNSIDFKSGNFSTNYAEAISEFSLLTKRFHQFSVALNYRRDFPLPGFAEFEESQNGIYGKNRFNFMLQYRGGAKTGCWPKRFKKHNIDPIRNDGNHKVPVPTLREHIIRLDVEYIFGGDVVDKFTFARLRYSYNPLRNRSMGYFAQATTGRDYLNIRYRLTGVTVMAGITFAFNKRYPSQDYIRQKLVKAYKFYHSPEYVRKKGKVKVVKQWCDCLFNPGRVL